MDELWLSLRLLALLAVANLAPIVAKRVLGHRWQTPIDRGKRFFDGRPLLGPAKTLRGLVSAIAASTLAAPLLGIPVDLGLRVGGASMAGDMLSSFVKRRLAIASSGRATGLDQVPEALLPLLAVRGPLELSLAQVLGVTLLFVILDLPFARLLHRMGIRDTPY
jgi:hypothetical protein